MSHGDYLDPLVRLLEFALTAVYRKVDQSLGRADAPKLVAAVTSAIRAQVLERESSIATGHKGQTYTFRHPVSPEFDLKLRLSLGDITMSFLLKVSNATVQGLLPPLLACLLEEQWAGELGEVDEADRRAFVALEAAMSRPIQVTGEGVSLFFWTPGIEPKQPGIKENTFIPPLLHTLDEALTAVYRLVDERSGGDAGAAFVGGLIGDVRAAYGNWCASQEERVNFRGSWKHPLSPAYKASVTLRGCESTLRFGLSFGCLEMRRATEDLLRSLVRVRLIRGLGNAAERHHDAYLSLMGALTSPIPEDVSSISIYATRFRMRVTH